jgi:ATP-dependent helicase/DNAse subunit B
MAAAVRVLCGPAGSGKTQRLIERYQSAVRSDPLGAALWLGPTHRAVEAGRPRLYAGLGGCVGARALTFQDFADELVRVNDPAARPLSHVQRRLLAEDIVAELHARGRLSHFRGVIDTRGFGDTVFELLAELKRNKIWPDQFTEAVARAGAREGGADAGRRKDEQCALIYAEYQRLLIRHNRYDLEGRFWYARDLLARDKRRPFEGVYALFLDGFTEFTHSQHEVLSLLCRWIQELWITLPDESGGERAELFTRTRQTLARLRDLSPCVEYLPPAGLACGMPAGLAHLERELFRPVKEVRQATDAGGLRCLEAPGVVGEARMVAREIKALLGAGVPPDDILVTLRDLPPYADLLGEVFAEYGIPVDIEGTELLHRNPLVATLLRSLRLPEEDWPFAQVTALLRSGYFRPDWPETRACPGVAQHAEALLRLLAEPRGREAYLRAVTYWAEHLPPGLEDEQAEESRRQRTHELAKKCRGFLDRFFRAWDAAPARGRLADHVTWLRSFADDLGLAAAANPRDAAALERFWDELDQWVRVERLLHDGGRVLERGQFHRMLGALAAEAGLPRTPRGPGRVRVLSAPLACGLPTPYRFVLGLGERSFPRLAAPAELLDEPERQAFRQAGLNFRCASDLVPDEMLLFYQVVTGARRQLVLSYPAVDEKGQPLLPGSFLTTLRECFQPDAIPTQRRAMVIEGLDKGPPLCPAELRVRLACAGPGATSADALAALSPHLLANLEAAAELVRARFHGREHGPYDGLLRDPAVVADVQALFGPERILSPTALENYIACPFKFFLGKVLRLEPLEEPSEEIDSTDRGLAFHRALARLHTHLGAAGIDAPTGEVDEHLLTRLDEAVAECTRQASPAGIALWKLEGRRLQRLAARYRAHWQKFLEPWLPRGVRPRPALFEVSFGLPVLDGQTPADPLVIAAGGVEVRISGRIDRVDVADLPDGSVGFWVIDYKTGRGSYYTGADLKAFRRLQLTLYALAVEQVLLDGKPARPLGLAYWLLAEGGPRVALPGHPKSLRWLEESEAWPAVRAELCRWVVTLVTNIRQGRFPLQPRDEHCTQTCDFGKVCRITQARPFLERKTWQLPLPTIS